MIIKCRTCGLPLTKPLSLLEDMSLTSIEDGTELVPPEHYFVGKGEYSPDMTGHVFANLKDVTNTKRHTEENRLSQPGGRHASHFASARFSIVRSRPQYLPQSVR